MRACAMGIYEPHPGYSFVAGHLREVTLLGDVRMVCVCEG